MEEGTIAIERTSSIVSANMYCGPITDRISLGATITATIIGAVKLNPTLKLSDDKSALDTAEAGRTINDILEDRLPITMLIINAK